MKQSQIEAYVGLLKDYNEITNVYSKSAYDRLGFHIQDSVCLAACIGNSPKQILDLGSGSGMPSVILAIQNDQSEITAVESRGRKASFIKDCGKQLGLANLRVLNVDANTLRPERLGRVDVVTAKAFAKPLDVLTVISKIGLKAGKLWIPASTTQCEDPGFLEKYRVHEAKWGDELYRYLTRNLAEK